MKDSEVEVLLPRGHRDSVVELVRAQDEAADSLTIESVELVGPTADTP